MHQVTPHARPQRALVLNATYEPLGVVSARRAAILVLTEKADTVVETETALRSERLVLALPSVIRLRTYVKLAFRRRAPLNRRAIFARDRGRCQYCGRTAESIDHVVPRSRGGTHTWENVVAACRPCNVRKRDQLLSEFPTMRLRSKPRPPHHSAWITVTLGQVPDAWGPFLGIESSPESRADEAVPA